MITVAYNVVLALAGIGWITTLRGPSRSRAIDAALTWGFAAIVLAVLLGEDPYGALRLFAWALFAQLPLLFTISFALSIRAHRIVLAAVAAALAVALVAFAIDAFWVEPFRLETTYVRIASRHTDRALRIAVLSDLQFDRFGAHERDAIRRAIAAHPDLVLCPGDYIQVADAATRTSLRNAFCDDLAREGFAPPLGGYAVQGNVDPDDWPETFAGTGVTCFTATGSVDVGPVRVTGLTLRDSFEPRLAVPSAPGFHIVLGHGPDFALGDIRADLLVAGHTHGGQVRLPFIGPLVTLSRVPRAWSAGATHLAGDRWLVVSRGVGLERGYAPRLRFDCAPQVVIIDVVPAR